MAWTIALTALCFGAGSVVADSGEQLDNTFNFVVSRNVPYVSGVLDQQVDNLQTLDIYRPQGDELSPVILYLHGGSWAFGDKADVHVKPHFFTQNNIAFVSMNYRLRWDYRVYDQLLDIVSAVKWLGTDGEKHGLDPTRIILMGHASGGHLASLVMADASYFEAEGMSTEHVRAVVSINSESYDIPRLMRELGSFVERRQHELIFTGNDDVWRAASPITHVAKNSSLPPFALLFNPESDASSLQARGFAKALSDADVQVVMIPGSADAPTKTDELLGTDKHVPTGALMAFLRSQI